MELGRLFLSLLQCSREPEHFFDVGAFKQLNCKADGRKQQKKNL